MADEADRAQQEVERSLAEAVRVSRRPVGPLANGRCHWCDEIVPDDRRWCFGTECREEWEKRK